jgi:hypothetical protein
VALLGAALMDNDARESVVEVTVRELVHIGGRELDGELKLVDEFHALAGVH